MMIESYEGLIHVPKHRGIRARMAPLCDPDSERQLSRHVREWRSSAIGRSGDHGSLRGRRVAPVGHRQLASCVTAELLCDSFASRTFVHHHAAPSGVHLYNLSSPSEGFICTRPARIEHPYKIPSPIDLDHSGNCGNRGSRGLIVTSPPNGRSRSVAAFPSVLDQGAHGRMVVVFAESSGEVAASPPTPGFSPRLHRGSTPVRTGDR
jgi:hypothetical protein